MKIGIFVGQAFSLDFGPNHEGVHGPANPFLLLPFAFWRRAGMVVVWGNTVVMHVVVQLAWRCCTGGRGRRGRERIKHAMIRVFTGKSGRTRTVHCTRRVIHLQRLTRVCIELFGRLVANNPFVTNMLFRVIEGENKCHFMGFSEDHFLVQAAKK